jgi:lipopolysaccharide export LptBFGC system permease protein LptF
MEADSSRGAEMGTDLSQFVGAGLFFVAIFLSGYWLSRSGKPYNVLVLTIHKMIAVAASVLLAVIMIQSNRRANLSTIELVAGVIAGLSFLSLVVTGGLLSSEGQIPAVVSRVHKIASYLTLISIAVSLYLL